MPETPAARAPQGTESSRFRQAPTRPVACRPAGPWPPSWTRRPSWPAPERTAAVVSRPEASGRPPQARVKCRSGPKCASIGCAQDAFVGVKHSSTLFRPSW